MGMTTSGRRSDCRGRFTIRSDEDLLWDHHRLAGRAEGVGAGARLRGEKLRHSLQLSRLLDLWYYVPIHDLAQFSYLLNCNAWPEIKLPFL